VTWILAGYLGLLAVAWAFIRGATSKPSPRRSSGPQRPNAVHPARGVLVYVEAPSTEVSGGGEVWDGADPTGPAPSP
jgi:hypothetical protein